jgi:hypothetical protein
MLEDLKPPEKVPTCGFVRLRQGLDGDDQHRLDEAMVSAEWSSLALAKALSERGLRISYAVLYRHRKKTCSCYMNGETFARESATS